MTRQEQNDQEKEENVTVQTAPATQATSKICWAGKKESHFLAFGHLLADDDDEDDEDAIDSDDE